MTKKSINIDIELCRGLYRNYGIAEWHEKSQILSKEEAILALKALESGEENELTELVKLPFPEFAKAYFAIYLTGDSIYEDPAFGYKLYLLPDSILRFFAEKARNPKLSENEIIKLITIEAPRIQISQLPTFFNTPYEELAKPAARKITTIELKYAYLTQYIDAEEARKLNLGISTLFERDGTNGFELEAKLDSLNPVIRSIIVLYMGLYGGTRLSSEAIAERLNLQVDYLWKVVNIIFPYLSRPLGEFRHAIGYLKDNQNTGGMKQYTNKTFRDIDITLQTRYIYNSLPEADRQVLTSYSNKELKIYLASKYMFRTPESLAKNFTLSIADAKDRLNRLK